MPQMQWKGVGDGVNVEVIKWSDSKSTSSGWECEDDLKPLKRDMCISVGFVQDENDDCLALVGTYSNKDEELQTQFLHRIVIPKVCVLSREVIRSMDKEDP